MKKKIYAACALVSLALMTAACSSSGSDSENINQQTQEQDTSEQDTSEQNTIVTSLDKISQSGWSYNEEDDVYWKIGIDYCENPADKQYETLGIFVPGAYFSAQADENGTYTCTINTENTSGEFTADTAPIVIPVNTPGYSAMSAPSEYVSESSSYTKEGFIYVNAGCRGRDHGAPAGVTDLKAAVRYIRYSKDNIPGNMESIFTFGMSGGGAQSALMGATGDSSLYDAYLEEIGAVSGVSDAVKGSMCWCPITNLDYANEAYEWNLGVTRTGLDEDTQKLSDSMAEAFADYIGELGLKDENGNVLSLEPSETGIYQSGSYYEYIKSVIENSLNNFLQDTEFPYDADKQAEGGRFGGGNMPEGRQGAGGENRNMGGFTDENGQFQNDGIDRSQSSEKLSISGIFDTPQDYINALNSENEWVTYDSESNTVSIKSVADFVKALKPASKGIGAFDDLDKTQGENTLFGYGDGQGAHFDPIMAELLKGTEYEESYSADLSSTDSLGNTVDVRMNMYNPMYYLSEYYDGFKTSKPASFWRIRTGIEQSDTALSTEVNLALALKNYGANVDFETVWGMGHTMAERTGESSENFIEWVKDCVK